MKITVKWFVTGRHSDFEDDDAIIGPQTSIWELKGLIQMQYGFKASQVLLLTNRLLENTETLRDIGAVDAESASKIILTAHVVAGSEGGLAPSNLPAGEEGVKSPPADESDDEDIMEFSHEDFITAMKMLGKTVAVSKERIADVRQNAPRARPQFLNQPVTSAQPEPAVAPAPAPAPQPAETVEQPTQSTAAQQPAEVAPSRLKEVLTNVWYGLRREEAESEFAVPYPGVAEPYQFWDLRLPVAAAVQVQPGDVEIELFYFGEFGDIDPTKFCAMVVDMLGRKGFKVQPCGPCREAGCMYPLVAVPLVMSEAEGWQLGDAVFERFGERPKAQHGKPASINKDAVTGTTSSGGCAQQ